MTETKTTEQILDMLNTYDGDNLYQDVIYGIEDADATEALNVHDETEFVGADGTHYVYAQERQEWIAR